MQSVDGVDWTERHSHVSVSFDRLATSGSAYAALGGFGAPTDIYYSPDGSLWSHVLAFQGIILKDITWGGGHFLACGQDGTVFLSDDGQTWSQEFVGDSVTLKSILWDGQRYLAAASNIVYTSTDAISWNKPTVDPMEAEPVITRMTWTGSLYATVGNLEVAPNDLRGYVYTSSDAAHWQEHGLGASDILNDIAWTGSRLVVCGRGGALFYIDQRRSMAGADLPY